MHEEQQKWCRLIKKVYPQYFIDKKVIDIGSLDINGNNKHLFTNCEYIGVDVIPGKNVDVVCIAHQLQFENETFDTVISTNALEHDMYFPLTMNKMVDLLKLNGLLLFSAAYAWKEHGTIRNAAAHSGTTQMGKQWAKYYKNITQKDIETNIDRSKFKIYKIELVRKDIRFYGIKND